MNSPRQIALDYARRGWAPVPVLTRAKAPALKDWSKLRLNEETVPRHFNGQPGNVGVLLGGPSGGLVDVDLDCDEAVRLAPHFLPATATFGRRAKPGSHWLYGCGETAGRTLKLVDPVAGAGDRAVLVELRGTGAQTVFPGSTHPSGEEIHWEGAKTEPMPMDWLDLSQRVRTLAAAALLCRRWTSGVRHNLALVTAGGLLGAGRAEDEVVEFIRVVAEAAGDENVEDRIAAVRDTAARLAVGEPATGWPTLAELIGDAAVDRLRDWLDIRAAEPAAQAADEPLPPAEPFPLDALPDGFRRLVEQGAASLVAPPDLIAVPLLGFAGAAIGNALELEVKPGWCEGSNLYVGSIAPPGSKKTPGQSLAQRGVDRIQRRLAREHAAEMEIHDQSLAEHEARGKRERGVRPKPPVFRHIVTTDATTEAIATMLTASKGIVLAKDELVSWVKAMDQYRSGGKGSDRQHYLSAWSRAPIKVDRKGAPVPIVVHRPHLSVVGGIQPDLLSELGDAAAREDGFLDRVLLSYPEQIPDRWTEDAVPEETVDAVARAFERLYALEPDLDEFGEPRPRVVRMSAAARPLLVTWYDKHAAESRSLDMPRLKGPWAKMPAQLARLALILHALRDPMPAELQPETFIAASALLDYFKSHARRVYRLLERKRREGREESRLMKALRSRGGELTRTELLRNGFGGNITAEELNLEIQRHATDGDITLEKRRTQGRPAVVIRAV